MTIRNMDAFQHALVDWGPLDDCFEVDGITVSDIDGYVERKGNFLYFEAKSLNGRVSTGQRISFESLVKHHKAWVLVIWHDGSLEGAQYGRLLCPDREAHDGICDTGKVDTTLDEIKNICEQWWDWAN